MVLPGAACTTLATPTTTVSAVMGRMDLAMALTLVKELVEVVAVAAEAMVRTTVIRMMGRVAGRRRGRQEARSLL